MINKAVLLMGPTATGKTELALRLAKHYPIEIISVDSALIYKDMDIGSAKPNKIELAAVKHHLIDIRTPLETYCVADFIEDSVRLIKEINQRGNLAVLVGGTMMYYNGLLNGISILPSANLELRAKLERQVFELGLDQLHRDLVSIDPKAASKIMSADKQRIIRALEVFYLTGKPISQLQYENKIHLAKDISFLSLAILPNKREILHDRIGHRFEKMLKQGFIAEVEALQNKYPELTSEHTSMRSVGYYQVWQYLNQLDYNHMLEAGTIATRQLAKRQITWLRSMQIINLDKADNLNIDSLFQELKMQINKF
jgi:tRNA dimethylallyltransferase